MEDAAGAGVDCEKQDLAGKSLKKILRLKKMGVTRMILQSVKTMQDSVQYWC